MVNRNRCVNLSKNICPICFRLAFLFDQKLRARLHESYVMFEFFLYDGISDHRGLYKKIKRCIRNFSPIVVLFIPLLF